MNKGTPSAFSVIPGFIFRMLCTGFSGRARRRECAVAALDAPAVSPINSSVATVAGLDIVRVPGSKEGRLSKFTSSDTCSWPGNRFANCDFLAGLRTKTGELLGTPT